MSKKLSFENEKNPELLLVQLLFHFSILMEYQLVDLQANVRTFVETMSDAIQKMDSLVVAEGQLAQELFENLFNKKDAEKLNTEANKRADKIVSEYSNVKEDDNEETENSSNLINTSEKIEAPHEMSEDVSKLWAEISKRFESVCRLEERLRPQVYKMIQSLNFEDMQTQRIEHALSSQKKINEGIMKFLKKGMTNCTTEEVLQFSYEIIKQTRSSYSMTEERQIFDQVFYESSK